MTFRELLGMLWTDEDDLANVRKEKGMKFILTLVVSGLTVAALLGCETVPQQAEKPTEPGEGAPVVAVPPRLPPPTMEGAVFRVWPYRNGELMALLGTKDGVRKGDMLMLTRGGDQINAIEVLNVQPEIFFGRVFERHTPELLPKVGDSAVRPPLLEEPEEVPAPEKTASKEPGKKK